MQIVRTTPTQSTDYVKDGVLYMGNIGGSVLVESANDLTGLPDYRPGTLAHTAGWKMAWEKAANGTWKNITGGEDVGGA